MLATEVPPYRSGLFAEVQGQHIFGDQKTFADAEPLYALSYIEAKYTNKKQTPDFDLTRFVQENFTLPQYAAMVRDVQPASIDVYIEELWNDLTRKPTPVRGSLITLPHPYVTPGGRFSELYYWDSYFILLGLSECDRLDLVEGMVDNFTHLIEGIGFIPNANRTYYLTRSQLPFYASMVRLLEDIKGPDVLLRYLPALEKEYAFWMKGSEGIDGSVRCCQRVVTMEDGSLLNRYWDTENTPRPEGYAFDLAIYPFASDKKNFFRNIRAACESGWDFSSRWLADGKNLHNICTIEIVPVDLNSMMLHLESTLLDAYTMSDNRSMRKKFEHLVARRAAAIEKYLWDPADKIYRDYHHGRRCSTDSISLAMLFPLYVTLSADDRAAQVLSFIKKHLLKGGGLLTSSVTTQQQWDGPIGWAPLQWVGYQSALNYGHFQLAQEIRANWLKNVEDSFARTGRLMEKYSVMTPFDGSRTTGEYPNQEGFGWTNGVYLKMKRDHRYRP